MIRKAGAAATATCLASLCACAGLVLAAGGPAQARYDDPVAALPYHPEWGSVAGESGKLRRGCHSYRFVYTITPPEGIWAMEVFISGPGFSNVAAGGFLDGYDVKAGTATYKLCRPGTRPGRFTIVGKVSVDDGAGHVVSGRTAASTYLLKRPRPHR